MSQLSPYNLNKNIAIRACAGAGKTYTLTWRYMAILNDFAKLSENLKEKEWLGPTNILTITFTKKATAELNNRILTTLNSILNGQKIDPPIKLNYLLNADKNYLEWLKYQLLNPNIMTIDAFCTSILKDNPSSSGVDSGMKMMDDYESKVFFNDCFHSFFNNLSKSEIKFLVIKFGVDNVQNIFTNAIIEQIHVQNVMDNYNYDEKEIFENWLNNYQKNVNFLPFVKSLFDCSEIIIKSSLPIDIIQEWQDYYEISSEILNSKKQKQINLFKEKLIPKLLTKGGKLKAKPAKTGNKSQWKKAGLDKFLFDEELYKLKNIQEQLNLSDIQCIFSDSDIDHAKLIKTVFNHFKNWFEFVKEKKSLKRVLTFKDLLLKTKKLLNDSPSIKLKLSEKFHHIMVDEFQDTTHSHWDIIKSIFQQNGKLKKSGLFIVGDEKQSIYRFNQADVTTFSRALADLKQCDSSFKPIDLHWNFRSTEKLISEGINPIFKKIFVNSEKNNENYQAVHQETEAHNQSENKVIPQNINFQNKAFTLDVFYVPEELKENDDELKYPLHIAKLVDEIIKQNPSKLENNCIGILLQAVKPVIGVFTEAFSQLGIKIEIVASSSFYQNQEVMDIEMLLSLILNPFDDVAFCGILKSPIFSLTDNEIHNMISNRDDLSIYQHLKNQNHYVFIEVENWIKRSKKIPIDRLIESIVNSKYRELAFLSEPNGMQVWANINKLISIIHNWSLAGDSIEQIRENLKNNISGNFSDNNFKIASNAKVVLMSIHKSKGLSFPFVIIPQLHRKFYTDHTSRMLMDFVIDKNEKRNIEIGFSPRDEKWDSINYALTSQLKQQQQIESFEESKRLLYVAITRAKYGVILSGKLNEKDIGKDVGVEYKKSKSWLDWFRKLYPIDKIISENEWKLDLINGPEIIINIIKKSQESKKESKLEEIEFQEFNVEKNENKFSQYAVTQLFNEFQNKEKVEDDVKSSINRGILIHKILEMNWLDYSIFKEDIHNWINSQNIEFQASIEMLDLQKEILGLLKLEKVNQIQKMRRSKCFTELWIQAILFSNLSSHQILITGIIDVLYYENNQWFVLDYKTGPKTENNLQYKNQIQTYLHLAKFCFGIEAIGQIFYVDENIIDTVEYLPNFIEKLKIEGITNYEFYSNKSVKNSNEIKGISKDQRCKIIVPNNKRKSDIWFELINDKHLHPNIKIASFAEFKNEQIKNRKPNPPLFIKRQIIQEVFKNKLNEFDLKNLPGIIDKLHEAFGIHAETDEYISPEIINYFQKYKIEIEKLGYSISPSNLNLTNISNNKNLNIYIEEPALVKQEDIEFLDLLNKCENIKFLKKYNRITNSKIYDKIQNKELKWIGFNSIQDEINFILIEIKKQLNIGLDLSEITIVLPSMEKYLPKIAGLFRREGIPLSIRKTEPISENPDVKSAICLFKLSINETINWVDLKTWLESEVNIKVDSAFKIMPEEIFELDILVRKNNFKIFEKSNFKELTQFTSDVSLINTIEFISKKIFELSNKSIRELIKYFQIEDAIESAAIKTFINLLNEIISLNNSFIFQLSDRQLLNEIIHLHTLLEYSAKTSDWGIEIISIMDSLYLKNKIVFVPGLNRDVFPIQVKSNPFIKTSNQNHEKSNFQIFTSWINENNNLFLTYPLYNESGEELSGTIFMDNFESEINCQPVYSLSKDKVINTVGKIINTNSTSKFLSRIINRHNSFLSEKIPQEYFGDIKDFKINSKKLSFSATSLDEIFLKPYFYLLKRSWNIFEIDSEQSSGLNKGDFVHKLFEEYANQNGWDLNRKNQIEAKRLFDKVSKQFIENYQNQFKLNIEELFWTMPTMFDLILIEEIDKIPKLNHYKSEAKFGNADSDSLGNLILTHPEFGEISFKGKIDRIDFCDDQRQILVQDYKTGNIFWDGLNGEMSRQLFVYFLVLKMKFPKSKICVTYREVKNVAKNGFYTAFIIDESQENFDLVNIKNSKKHIIIENKGDIEKQIFQCLNPLLDKYFPPFSNNKKKIDVDNYYYLKSVSRIESIKYFLK